MALTCVLNDMAIFISFNRQCADTNPEDGNQTKNLQPIGPILNFIRTRAKGKPPKHRTPATQNQTKSPHSKTVKPDKITHIRACIQTIATSPQIESNFPRLEKGKPPKITTHLTSLTDGQESKESAGVHRWRHAEKREPFRLEIGRAHV